MELHRIFGDTKIYPLPYERPSANIITEDDVSDQSSNVHSLYDAAEDNKKKANAFKIAREREELREKIMKEVMDKVLPDIEAYKFDDDASKKKKVDRFETITKILKYFACIELDLHDAVLSANIYHVRNSVRKITQGENPQPHLLNQFDQHGCTPLSYAVKINQSAVALFLLESGASPDYIDEGSGRTPIYYSVLNKNLEISNYLIAAGADANIVDFQCISPLMVAAAQNDVGHCQLLCKANGETDLQDEHGWTALHHAAMANAPDAIFFLLEEGINRDLRDVNKRKAIHIAKFKKHGECEYLLNSKPRKIV